MVQPQPPQINVWYPASSLPPPLETTDESLSMLLWLTDVGPIEGGYDNETGSYFVHVERYDDFDDPLSGQPNNADNINQNLSRVTEETNGVSHWMLIRIPEL